MKAWWQQLNSREQRLVAIMGTFFIIFLLYSLIWQPLNEKLVSTQKKLTNQQALLTWVRDNTTRYQQISKSSKTSDQGSLSSIVNRTANQHQITVTRLQPQGDDLQIWIDEIAFSELLLWLEDLSINEGLHVTGIDLSRADKEGIVQVRRLQLGRG